VGQPEGQAQRAESAGATGRQIGELLAQHPAAHAFEVVHQCGDGKHRRVLHQQLNVVRFAVQLHQLEAHLLGNAQADL